MSVPPTGNARSTTDLKQFHLNRFKWFEWEKSFGMDYK